MSTASGKTFIERSRFLAKPSAVTPGLSFLTASWLDSRIPAAIAGACIVSKMTSTVSSSDDATRAVQFGFSPKAVSMVFATMRFVFIVPLMIDETFFLADDNADKETA